MSEVGYAVVGVRNFAETHIDILLGLEDEEDVKLTAVVARNQKKNAEKIRELRKKGVKVFDSYEELLSEKRSYIDIITLPISIPTHEEAAVKGMKAGYDILLEKPPAPTISQIDRVKKVSKETGKFCSIGFQFLHSSPVRRLKKLIMNDKIGEIEEIACKAYWPRYKPYYERNAWAGRLISNGRLVLDGPMHNACAHFLNNMLFLAANEMNETEELSSVRGELYRSRDYIQSPDTSCLEAETKDGIKIYFYVTHSSQDKTGPIMEVKGDKGEAKWDFCQNTVWDFSQNTEVCPEGEEKIEFDGGGEIPWLEVFRVATQYFKGEMDELYSTPANSRNFVVAINGAYESAEKVRKIPSKYVEEFETDEGLKTELEEIESLMDEAFDERKLLSDLGVEWAEPTDPVDVENYEEFNPFES